MPSRILADSILWDESVQALSPEAFSIYVRMLVLADDYGIGPANPGELSTALGLGQTLKIALSRKFPEIPGNGLIRVAKFKTKLVYNIKPESWDRIQWNLVRKRTKSKHLGEVSEIVEAFRVWLWSDQFDTFNWSSGNFPEFPGISRLARANYSYSDNKIESDSLTPESSEEDQKLQKEEAVNDCSKTTPAPKSRLMQVLDTFHRIQDRTGIDPTHFPVSEIGWTADLRKAGQTYGHQCLLREAEKFEVWFVELCQQKPQEKLRKHKPKARFLNSWMSRVKPELYTTGDDEFETIPTAGQFSKFLQQDAA